MYGVLEGTVLGAGDVTPPIFNSSSISLITIDGFTINAETNESSTIYYVVVSDGAGAPSVAQVKLGQDSTGSDAIASGNTVGTTLAAAVSALGSGNAYDIYIVATDTALNDQAAVTALGATTGIPIDFVINFGGLGTEPTEAGFFNVGWPDVRPANNADYDLDIDYGVISDGISLVTVNTVGGNRWEGNGTTAIHDLGPTTAGAGYGVDVIKHGWFVPDNILGEMELRGVPAGTYTIQCFGARRGITGPRTSTYNIDATTLNLDVDDNTDNYVEFTGVTPAAGVINIKVGETTPQDLLFGYINWLRIIQTT
jgi:hypothetical protein